MEDLNAINNQLSSELARAELLLKEQRAVISALGELVREMMETLAHYERLWQASSAARPPRDANINE